MRITPLERTSVEAGPIEARRFLCGVLALFVCAPLACTQAPQAPPPNLFIVVVDTLRADRFAADERKASLTPYLDSLAETSTVFHNAYSTSAWTSPAVASLFTSRYPSQHGVVDFDSVLPGPEITLAEILERQGYRSGGFSSNLLIGRGRGFQQGFEFFRERGTRELAGVKRSERTPEAAQRALDWIDRRPTDASGPIFVYLHVVDPHAPYAPDAAAMERVFAPDARPDPGRVNRVMQGHLSNPIPEEVRRDVRGLYDAEVNSTDAALERFFSELSRRDLLDDSIVVVTSDHGEELWEHGMFGHHHSLYGEVLRVPLLIRTPGQMQRRDVFERVSLLDVAPTLLELMGLAPADSFEGRSLVASITRSAASDADASGMVAGELLLPAIFRRTPHERTVILGDAQLIRHVDGSEEFIDLAAEGAGESGGGVTEAEKRALRKGLDQFLARYANAGSVPPAPDERVEMDEETREELRALGYVE